MVLYKYSKVRNDFNVTYYHATITNKNGDSFRVTTSLEADTTPKKRKELAAKLDVDRRAEKRQSLGEAEKAKQNEARQKKRQSLGEDKQLVIRKENAQQHKETYSKLSPSEKAKQHDARKEKRQNLGEDKQLMIRKDNAQQHKEKYSQLSPTERREKADKAAHSKELKDLVDPRGGFFDIKKPSKPQLI